MCWSGEKGPVGFPESTIQILERQIIDGFPKDLFDFPVVRFQSILLKHFSNQSSFECDKEMALPSIL